MKRNTVAWFVLLGSLFSSHLFAAVTTNLPTTVSGGTGSLSSIQTPDNAFYTCSKNQTVTIGGFSGFGGAITSVYLLVEYTVEAGYDGTNALHVGGFVTPLVPRGSDRTRQALLDITAGSYGIDTSGEITALSITFANNSSGAGKNVTFDYAYLLINPELPIHMPPTWSDEFSGSGAADSAFWTYEVGYQRNNEDQYYVAGSANGWQTNGMFVIEGREESMGGYNYTSASIYTKDKYYWLYGRAQIRAQIPAVPGLWPAIWGCGKDTQWPHNGEVDIMEYYGEGIKANCAVGDTTAWTAKWSSSSKSVPTYFETLDPGWRTNFHVWTMQWDQDNVRLYVDNVLLKTVTQTWLKNTDGFNTTWGPKAPYDPSYPFKQPFHCWLNLAIGGNAGGDPTNPNYPVRYFIDYWRVWEGATNNVAPTDVAITTSSVREGLPAGTVVGYLSATDADPAEVIRYTLVTGTGDTHNSQFSIPEFLSDNTKECVLKTAAVLNYADGTTRSIRVRATDIEGATFDKILTINVSGNPVIDVSPSSVAVPEGTTNTVNVRLQIPPVSDVTVNISRISGDTDLSVVSGGTLTFTPANGTNWQQVVIAAAQDADTLDGSATFQCVDAGGTYSNAIFTASELDDDNQPPVVDAGTNQTVALTITPIIPPVAGAAIFLDAGLDDGANAVWEDSQNFYNLAIDTNVTFVADAGSALQGITSAYDFPGGLLGSGGCSGASLQGLALDTSPITLELWFKPDVSATYPSNGQVLWETGGATGFGIFYRDGFVEVAHDSNAGQISADVSSLISEFIQVVVTYNTGSSTSNFKLYINGVLKATANRSDTDLCGGDGSGLGKRGGSNVGGAGTGNANSESFNGKIAIFRSYTNRLLTVDEVLTNYCSIAEGGTRATAILDATITDPNGDPMTVEWTQQSGPAASVVIAPANAVDATATFRSNGVYVLRLTASDGRLQAYDEVTITVGEEGPVTPALMTLYDQANASGAGYGLTNTYTSYSGAGIPGGLDNQISSFVLEQGYMVVVAAQTNGLQPSKTYIASEGPLVVNTLPAELDNQISFIRIVPWRNTLKKGLGEQNDARVEGSGLDWYYNWGASVVRGQTVTNREFVPMSWGHTGSYPAAITNYLAMNQVSTLLSFNEPDYPDQQSGQWGNLSIVSTAVVYHADLQKAGLRLGSPAPHEENAGGTNDWLTLFLNETEAAGIRTDFVALHWYDWGNNPAVNTNPTPESVLNRLKGYLSNSYHLYRKPLWITEFNANPARAKPIHDAFIQMALPYLDSVGYVERYAYFQTPTDSGNFFDVNTNITTTGVIWRDHVSVPAYVPRGLPSPWLTSDVGAVAQTGDALHANGVYTVCGTGAGITGTADEFSYVYQPISGDITISAKINSMIWRHNDTHGGVMIRETLTPGSKHAMMALTSSNGAKFRYRATTGGSTANTIQTGITAPYWVKLVRSGTTLTGYHSPDGTTWTQSGTQTITMSNTVYIGMAVSANNDGVFNDVIFTDVAVSTAAATYTITYDGNSHTGGTPPAPQTKTNDVALTLASNTGSLVCLGYTFSGWNTAANGLGTDYAAGASYTTNASATLYAKWTPNTYAVSFNGNGGGTPSPTNTVVTYGSTYGTLATVARTGYAFNGWFTAPSGGTQITSGTTVAITSAQPLYAQWTPNNYTVTFNANGGDTPDPTSMSVVYDSTYGTLATVTRTGYSFLGWFTAISGGTQITSGTTVAITSGQTLYAQWSEDVKLPATVTLGNLSQTYDGTARMVTYTTSPTGLAVTVTYNGGAGAPTNAGTYAVIGTVVSATYEGSTNGTLVVSQATPVVTNWPTASSIELGQALSNATLNGGSASVPGSFIFVSPTNIPPAGVTNAAVMFAPNDSVNYASVTGTVAVIVVDISAVPFFEPFEARAEGNLNNQYGWVADGTVVQTNKAYNSAKGAQILGGGGYLKHTFSDGRTKVWTDLRIQVVHSQEKPTPETNATVAVYVWTNSIVYAFHGTNAVPTGIAIPPGTNVWTRFTTFSDYTTRKYTLYVNDVRVDKYDFYNTAVTNFTELKVSGEATFVDDVGVTPNQPAMKYMPSLILLQ